MQQRAKSSISATCVLGEKYIGKVNVDNRILSDKCELTILNNSRYRLVQFDALLPEGKAFWETAQLLSNLLNNWDKVRKIGTVVATIDGKTYSGSEIVIDGESVYVDSKLSVSHTFSSTK